MNGLSTLNRLLGKRNKDVSKSTSNLSRSTTNLDSTNQYNKIVPLAAMTNAPFEQTFRITVLLPRDQLYVTRIGAKTRLAVLMDMVCSDKLLDPQKYLFRHPADFHQGFELDLTIGEVGLNEIRLISKKELDNLRNNEYRLSTSDIFRLHQKNIRENSVSSSDLSRHSRTALKTTSPYSSTNSLNSMDSSGLSSSSRGGLNGTHNHHHPPVAPTRKKRMAPRPPSQNSIPEKAPFEIHKDDHIFKEPQLPPYSRKNFHVSSPNLYNGEVKIVDTINNNNNNYNGQTETNGNGHHVETVEEMNNLINTKTSYSTLKNRPTSMYIIREPSDLTDDSANTVNHENLQRTSLNGTGGVNNSTTPDIVNHSRTSSNSSEVKDPRDFQEGPHPSTTTVVPTPRKRLNSNAKKSKAPAPAPPPRGVSLLGSKQREEVATMMATEPKIVPTPSPRAPNRGTTVPIGDGAETIISSTDSNLSETDAEIQKNQETVNKLNAVNSAHQPQVSVEQTPSSTPTHPSPNVSKVMLNVDHSSLTSTDPPSSLSPEVERKPSSGASSVSITIVNEPSPVVVPNNGHSKPSTPIISKVHIVPPTPTTDRASSEEPVDRRLSNGGHSSDEDIKIYNIESGQEMRIPDNRDTVRSPSPAEEEEQWTYTLPAPPKFADSSIKSGEYDEKQRFFDLQSTFVDNTTIVTDRMTIHSDVTEEIRPIIREKVLMDESLEEIGQKCSSPTETLVESEGGNSSVTGEIMINSDIEDGYRGGSEVRETMIQTLEKRREKLKESELQDLKESIEGVMVEQKVVKETEEEEEMNESDIMKCAKLNEETVVDDYTMVVKRSSVVSVTRSQSVVEGRRLSDEKPAVDRKSEVISELNQVIKDENALKAVLNGKKMTEEDEDIVGANKNSLSNFKISSYNGENKENVVEKPSEMVNGREEKTVSGPVSQKSDDSEEETNVIVRRKISADSISRSKLSSDEDESGARLGNKNHQGPVKRRSLTVLNKSPKNINRSDSFHSTRSDYIQSLASVNGLRLTPRSTSYISLIGAQKFENRFAQSNRRKSTSEMSICDSPSLQSLEVIKNILNNSKSNLAMDKKEVEEIMPMASIKRNSFTDISTLVQFKSEVIRSSLTRPESMVEQKIEEVESKKLFDEKEIKKKPVLIEKIESAKEAMIEESVSMTITDSEKAMSERVVDVSNESKSDDEKLQNRQLSAAVAKQPQTTVVNITTTSTTVASSGVSVTVNADKNEKRWTYQGPPTINFTTWSERPKIDVSIKSDKDYRFGGSSTLPRGYRNVNNTTKVNLNVAPAPALDKENGIDLPDSREHVPFNDGESRSLPQDINPEPVLTSNSDRLPIVRAVEYKKNVVLPPPVAQKPLDKPYFYDTYSRTPATSTATINRLSMGFNKFQPVVRGFKSTDEKDVPATKPRPVSMIESSTISTAILKTTPTRMEKPIPEVTSLPFGQNTLRRTGLKDKILAQTNPEPVAVAKPAVQEAPVVAVKVAAATTAAPPPPPPVAPKLTTPVVRGAIVKKPLPSPDVDPRTALLDAIRNFNKDKLRAEQ